MRAKVCLILSAKGFHLRGKFQVKELAFVNFHPNCVPNSEEFQVDEPRTRQETSDVVSAQNDHGLSFEGGGIPQDEFLQYLVELYNSQRTSPLDHVAVKGDHELQEVLEELDIPFIDLDDYGCPDYDLGTFPDFTCSSHIQGRRCVRSMVAFYRQWMLVQAKV